MKNEKKLLKTLNLFAFVAMVAVNVLAQTAILGGLNTAEISALYPTLLTPAGITFSIWGVIYALACLFVLQQIFAKNDSATEKFGWLFALSCGLNIAWIFLWQYQLMLPATIVIAVLWVLLLQLSSRSSGQPWFIRAMTSIYLAWITVATAAQVFILLSVMIPAVHLRMNAVLITMTALLILTLYSLAKIIGSRDIFFGLAMIWAIGGVVISHATPAGYNNMFPELVTASAIACAIVAVAVIWLVVKMIKRKRAVKAVEKPV